MNPQTQDENRDQQVIPPAPVAPVASTPEADAAALKAIDALEAETDIASEPEMSQPSQFSQSTINPVSPNLESAPTVVNSEPVTQPVTTPSGFESSATSNPQPLSQDPSVTATPVTPTEVPAAPAPTATPQTTTPFATQAPANKKTPLIIAAIAVVIIIGAVAGYLIWQAL